jgi:hypothetical protein
MTNPNEWDDTWLDYNECGERRLPDPPVWKKHKREPSSSNGWGSSSSVQDPIPHSLSRNRAVLLSSIAIADANV